MQVTENESESDTLNCYPRSSKLIKKLRVLDNLKKNILAASAQTTKRISYKIFGSHLKEEENINILKYM